MNEIIKTFRHVITNNYAQFKGKANRREFLMYAVAFFLINTAFLVLINFFRQAETIKTTLIIINTIILLLLLTPSLAICVRRMKYIGKSGSWVLINLIPIIGSIWFAAIALKKNRPVTNRFESNEIEVCKTIKYNFKTNKQRIAKRRTI